MEKIFKFAKTKKKFYISDCNMPDFGLLLATSIT